jgi:hypothetical protein
LLLIACFIGYYGLIMLRRSIHLLHKGMLTTGVYKGNKRVEFVTASGMKLVTAYQYRSRQVIPLGKQVRVLYDAQQPGIASVASFQELALSPAYRLCGASGFVAMSLLTLFTSNVGIGALGLIGTQAVGVIPAFLYARHIANVLQARFEATM